MIGLLCFALAVLASPFDHVRPCNLKPQQRDLTPVLRRPVEPAVKSVVLTLCQPLPVCPQLRTFFAPCVEGSELARAFFTFCSIGRCSHVFGLLMRFT